MAWGPAPETSERSNHGAQRNGSRAVGRGVPPVSLYFATLIILSVAAVIEARCSTPSLRPGAQAADRGFWLVLLAWGFWRLPWWQPLAGLVGSLAANALVVGAGAQPYWPGFSMAAAVIGLLLASVVLAR